MPRRKTPLTPADEDAIAALVGVVNIYAIRSQYRVSWKRIAKIAEAHGKPRPHQTKRRTRAEMDAEPAPGPHGAHRTVGVGRCGALVAGEDGMEVCGVRCEQNPFVLQVRCWRHIAR